jgi:hypothetical protein
MGFGEPKMPTPEEMAKMQKERALSDAELIKGGAEYVVDGNGMRLDATSAQKDAAENEMNEKLERPRFYATLEKLRNVKSIEDVMSEIIKLTGEEKFAFDVEKNMVGEALNMKKLRDDGNMDEATYVQLVGRSQERKNIRNLFSERVGKDCASLVNLLAVKLFDADAIEKVRGPIDSKGSTPTQEEKENSKIIKIPENLTRDELVLVLENMQDGKETGKVLAGKLMNGPIEVGKYIQTAHGNSSNVASITRNGETFLIKTISGSEYRFDPSMSIEVPKRSRK